MLRPYQLLASSRYYAVLLQIGVAQAENPPRLLDIRLLSGHQTWSLTPSFQFHLNYSPVCKSHFEIKSLWENEDKTSKCRTVETQQDLPSKHNPVFEYTFKFASDKQEEVLNNILEQKHVEEVKKLDSGWPSVKSSVLEMSGGINNENIDAVIINKCCDLRSLHLGKSYFKYLKSVSTKINRATYGNYLMLFYKCSSNCSETDLKEIEVVYRELLLVHPVLDSYTAEKAVFGLSITSNWKEYEKLFKIIEVFYHPSPSVYAVVIITAFKNKHSNLGWHLLEEMQSRCIKTPDEVFIFILKNTETELKNEVLTKVLEFLCRFNIKPSLDLSKVLKSTFEESSNSRKGSFTTVSRSGKCRNCNSQLEPAKVLENQYEELKNAFLNPVLIGNDIFLKTKPEEFNSFLEFLREKAPFDVVLDGLNIAFKGGRSKKTPSAYAFQLKSVVKHFVTKNQKVLVLGRKHMTRWPAEDMNYVFSKSEVFLADDISQDDPFLLYATLYSGLGTRFVSRDMMRNHKFLLAKPQLQATFQKWQAQHQYFLSFIEDNGTVHMHDPITFMQSIQQNLEGDWHIPYATKENLLGKVVVDNFHYKWLCLVNGQRSTKQVWEKSASEKKMLRKNVKM